MNDIIQVNENNIRTGTIAQDFENHWRYCSFEWSEKRVTPIYAVPLANGDLKVAYSRGDSNISVVSTLSSSSSFTSRSYSDWERSDNSWQVRGFTSSPDDSWFALLTRLGFSDGTQNMRLEKVGNSPFDKTLEDDRDPVDPDIVSRINDFRLGDGRLVHGIYDNSPVLAAYYKVSTGVLSNFHQGDTMALYDVDTGKKLEQRGGSTGWDWGCSHSMEERLVYSPQNGIFGSVCVSDCFPAKGTFFQASSSKTLYLSGGNCGGLVEAGVGGLVVDTEDPFGGDFFAIIATPRFLTNNMSQGCNTTDVGLVQIGFTISPVMWLTDTPDESERNTHLALYGPNLLVAWENGSGNRFLATVSKSGEFIKGPEDVTSKVSFTDGIDFFNFPNGDVGWVTSWDESVSPARDWVFYNTELSKLKIVRVQLGGSVCGNLIREFDEACDDGGSCCSDNCELEGECSDLNGPCCVGCSFVAAGTECASADPITCEGAAVCTGDYEKCPPNPPCQLRSNCKTPNNATHRCTAPCPWAPDCPRDNACEVGCWYAFVPNPPSCIPLSAYGGDGWAENGFPCDAGNGECQSGVCQALSRVCGKGHANGDGMCCDTDTGQYKEVGSLCRPQFAGCDEPDYCSGSSALCPNSKRSNGLACSIVSQNITGTCESGLCISDVTPTEATSSRGSTLQSTLITTLTTLPTSAPSTLPSSATSTLPSSATPTLPSSVHSTSCQLTTCQVEGATCGIIEDGCSGQLDCGDNSTCQNVLGENAVCNSSSNTCVCTPKYSSCLELPNACGNVDTLCGSFISCGLCQIPEFCNISNQCECIPETCESLGLQCGGPHDDGCGGEIPENGCGMCSSNENCSNGICLEQGCSPVTSCELQNAECGNIRLGDIPCPQNHSCGSCRIGDCNSTLQCDCGDPTFMCTVLNTYCGLVQGENGCIFDCGSDCSVSTSSGRVETTTEGSLSSSTGLTGSNEHSGEETPEGTLQQYFEIIVIGGSIVALIVISAVICSTYMICFRKKEKSGGGWY